MYDSFLNSGVSVVCGLKCNVVPLLNHLIEGDLQRVLLGGRHAHLLSAVQYSRPPVLLVTSSSLSMNSSRLSRSTFLRLEPEFGVMSNPIIVDILVVQYNLGEGFINNQRSCFSCVINDNVDWTGRRTCSSGAGGCRGCTSRRSRGCSRRMSRWRRW